MSSQWRSWIWVVAFVAWVLACSCVLFFVVWMFDGSEKSDLEILVLYLMGALAAPTGFLIIAGLQIVLMILGLLFDFELRTSIHYLVGLWFAFFASGVTQWVLLAKWMQRRKRGRASIPSKS